MRSRASAALALSLAATGLAAFAPPPTFEVRLAPGHMDAKAGKGSGGGSW